MVQAPIYITSYLILHDFTSERFARTQKDGFAMQISGIFH